jgi:DNA replication protein DnaC
MNYETNFLNDLRPLPYLEPDEKYEFQSRMITLMRIATAVCPNFELGLDNRSIYENTVRYFAADASGVFDIKKGLYVYGPVGIGKTLYFKIFEALNRALMSPNKYNFLTITDIADGVGNNGLKYFQESGITPGGSIKHINLHWRRPSHIMIDDLGKTAVYANHYSNRYNIVEEIIRRRYYVYTDKFSLTHISTNMEPKEIDPCYGNYVASRMREMFNIILFPGKDRRK